MLAAAGDGIHIRQITWLSFESIHLVIDIRASALPGSRDVTVLTPEGYGETASAILQVTPYQVRQASQIYSRRSYGSVVRRHWYGTPVKDSAKG